MLLNLYIIAKFLEKDPLQGRVRAVPSRRPLKFAVLYEPDAPAREDRLYLADGGDPAPARTLPPGSALLCLGRPCQEICGSGLDYLWTERSVSLYTLLTELQELFVRFTDYEDQLRAAAATGDLQTISNVGVAFLRNPVALYTSMVRLICYGERSKPAGDTLFVPEDLGQRLQDEELAMLAMDSATTQAGVMSSPAIFSSIGFDYRILYYNIHLQGRFWGRVCVCETDDAICQCDYALAMLVGQYYTAALKSQGTDGSVVHSAQLDQVIDDLVSGRLVSEDVLDYLEHSLDWREEDIFFCCKIVTQRKVQEVVSQAYGLRLEEAVLDSLSFGRQGSIFYLVNLTHSRLSREDVLSRIAPLLRDGLLQVGISEEFHGLRHLFQYYRQAELALQLGQEIDPTFWSYRFEHYCLRYLLQPRDPEIAPQTLCHPGLLRLLEHDRAHNKRYARTLSVYLRNNMNIAKTSREVYVQRPTLIYQLNRMQEILQADLSDYPTRLHIMLSFELLGDTP